MVDMNLKQLTVLSADTILATDLVYVGRGSTDTDFSAPVAVLNAAALPAAADDELLVYNATTMTWGPRSLNGFPIVGLADTADGFVYFQNASLRFTSTTTSGAGSQDGDHPQLLSGQMVWGKPALGFFSGVLAPNDAMNPDAAQLVAAPVQSSYIQEISPPLIWHKNASPNSWVQSFTFPADAAGLDTSQVNQLIDNHDDVFGLTFDPATDRIQLRSDSGGTQNSLALRGFDMYYYATSLPPDSVGNNGDWNTRQNGAHDEKVNGAWVSRFSPPTVRPNDAIIAGTSSDAGLWSPAGVKLAIDNLIRPVSLAASPTFFRQLHVNSSAALEWVNPDGGQVVATTKYGVWYIRGGLQTLLDSPTANDPDQGPVVLGWNTDTARPYWAEIPSTGGQTAAQVAALITAHTGVAAAHHVKTPPGGNADVTTLGPTEAIPDATEAQYTAGAVLFKGGVEYAVGQIVGPPVGAWTFATLTAAYLFGYVGVTATAGSLYTDYPEADQAEDAWAYIRQSRRWATVVGGVWAITNAPNSFLSGVTSEEGIRQAHDTVVGEYYFDLSYELVRYIASYDAMGGMTPVIGYHWVAAGGGGGGGVTGRYVTSIGQLEQSLGSTDHIGRSVGFSTAPTPVSVVDPILDNVPKNLRIVSGELLYNELGDNTEVSLGSTGVGGVTAEQLTAAILAHRGISAAHHVPGMGGGGVTAEDLAAAILAHKDASAAHHVPITTAEVNTIIGTFLAAALPPAIAAVRPYGTTAPVRSGSTSVVGTAAGVVREDHRHQASELEHVGGVAGDLAGLWLGTQTEYDAITGHDANTVYHVR